MRASSATLFPPATAGQFQGDTAFEQVVCAGLNTASDTLGAVIWIKRPNGYSGTLCQTGSTEFVAFRLPSGNEVSIARDLLTPVQSV